MNTRSDCAGTLTTTLPFASLAVSVPLGGKALVSVALAGRPAAADVCGGRCRS